MQLAVQIIHVVLSIILIILVLVQNEGKGLGAGFGGGGEVFHTKRGFERFLFIFTIVIAVLFTATSVGNIVLS